MPRQQPQAGQQLTDNERLAITCPTCNAIYQLTDFEVPASDGSKGQPGTRRYFRISMGYAAEIDHIVLFKRFSYRSFGAFVRHAIKRHIKWLQGLGANVSSRWAQTEAIEGLCRESHENAKWGTTIAMLDENVSECVSNGERGEARRLVRETAYFISQMKPGRWKEKWEEVIGTRYNYLNEGVEPDRGLGSLMEGEQEE